MHKVKYKVQIKKLDQVKVKKLSELPKQNHPYLEKYKLPNTICTVTFIEKGYIYARDHLGHLVVLTHDEYDRIEASANLLFQRKIYS